MTAAAIVLTLLWACGADPVPTPVPTSDRPAAPVDAGPAWVGSEACAECHEPEVSAWRASNHALAERLLDPVADAEALAAMPGNAEGSPVLVADGPEGPGRFEAVRVLGREPLWQLIVPMGGGEQVSQLAYHPQTGSWFDVFDDDGRGPGEWGHWTGGAMTWNSKCAACHNTRVQKRYDPARAAYDTQLAERGVGCEACHGPSGAHARGGPPPVLTPRSWLDTCGSCHARRADLTEAFAPGDAFLDHFAPTLPDPSPLYWPDGQVRDEVFEHTAFLGSVMHDNDVLCTSCHDPHSAALRLEGDALCLSCHAAQPAFSEHDPHEEPVGCVGCHMPVTVYMARDPRHDHGFTVPDPVLTAELGIPNACTRCHEDRPVAWAVDAARSWYGDGEGARRSRARTLHAAFAGRVEVLPELLALTRAEGPAQWRAVAVAALEPFGGDPDARARMVEALGDEAPRVRFAAAGALAPYAPLLEVRQALERAAGDELRAVRVQAMRALRGGLDPNSSRARDYRQYLELNRDDATALHELATWWLERGQPERALPMLERALSWDPSSTTPRHAMAIAYAQTGRGQEAADALAGAVALDPDDAELHFAHGLALSGVGDTDGAERALARAAELAPTHPRVWINLGLARHELGRTEPALAALRRATEVTPEDPEAHYALASVCHAVGRAEQARTAAERVIALAPGHSGARAILGGPPDQ